MKAILFGLVVAAATGCVQMQPVGPLAKSTGTPKGGPAKDDDDPVTVPAPRPAAPAMFIVPAEVSSDDPGAAARKLMAEFESDRKTLSTGPRTAEVSVYKGGVKQ